MALRGRYLLPPLETFLPHAGSGLGTALAGAAVAAVQVGDAEGEVEGLAAVEAGIACRLVAVAQVTLSDTLAAAGALGDVVAGELDVDAAGVGAKGPVHFEEPGDLVQHVVEVPGLPPLAASTVLPCMGSHTQI